MNIDQKKQILAVVLNTDNISVEDAKQNYLNQLNVLINSLNNLDKGTLTDAQYLRAIKATIAAFTPKLQLFDYDAALEQLQQQDILITKKQLSKFINLK